MFAVAESTHCDPGKGFRFERHVVDLSDESERIEFQELYAMGTLPILRLNHGPLIPESTNIIEYLETLGGKPLISQGPDVARKTRFKDKFFDLYLSDSVATLMNRETLESNSEAVETAKYRLTAVYDFLEYEVRDQVWANGEHFAMSDCAAVPALLSASKILPFENFPNVTAYAARLRERPSVARVRDDAG